VNGLLTCVSPEESAKQKAGTEGMFLVTKSTHVTVLSDLFVVLFLDKESLTKTGWSRTQHGERAISCDIARVNIFTFFEHHIAWLYVSGIVNCMTFSILPIYTFCLKYCYTLNTSVLVCGEHSPAIFKSKQSRQMM
jgi:hypothetical protein